MLIGFSARFLCFSFARTGGVDMARPSVPRHPQVCSWQVKNLQALGRFVVASDLHTSDLRLLPVRMPLSCCRDGVRMERFESNTMHGAQTRITLSRRWYLRWKTGVQSELESDFRKRGKQPGRRNDLVLPVVFFGRDFHTAELLKPGF